MVATTHAVPNIAPRVMQSAQGVAKMSPAVELQDRLEQLEGILQAAHSTASRIEGALFGPQMEKESNPSPPHRAGTLLSAIDKVADLATMAATINDKLVHIHERVE